MLGVNVILVLFSILRYADSTSSLDGLSDYMEMTKEQQAALDNFPPLALVGPFLKNSYRIRDSYPLRWFRSNNYNLHFHSPQKFLPENLRWRRRRHYNIDTIINEDFSDLRKDYPLSVDAHDKKGMPIGVIPLGSWNLRRAVLSGTMPRLQKYIATMLEVNRNVLGSINQARNKNVTQFRVIANMDGYNPFQHGCPICLLAYISFVRTVQSHYPGYTNQFVLVNTPPSFKAVLDSIQPFLAPRTRRTFKVFGRNRATWMEYLQQDISKEELAKVKALQ